MANTESRSRSIGPPDIPPHRLGHKDFVQRRMMKMALTEERLLLLIRDATSFLVRVCLVAIGIVLAIIAILLKANLL